MHYCNQPVLDISIYLKSMSSVFRLLISFSGSPWLVLVCYVLVITTTRRVQLWLIISRSSLYTEDYSVLLYYSQYCYGEISILFLYLFTRFFWKMDKTFHCLQNYNYIPIFSFVRLKYRLSIFLANFGSVLSSYFQSQYFEAVKEFHTFCIYIFI